MAESKGYSLTDGLSQIASVLKSNGIDGELILGFRDIEPDDINLKEPVFIIFDGLPVPFFIESLVKRGYSKALVHLTDIRTYDDAEELVGKAVYLKGSNDEEKSIEDFGFEALIGWTLLAPLSEIEEEDTEIEEIDEDEEDMELEEIGEIIEYYDIPGNPCIEVDTKNGAVMIPLHEDLILSVDPEYKEIIMSIPDGLID